MSGSRDLVGNNPAPCGNSAAPVGDSHHMSRTTKRTTTECAQYRLAASADLDGEDGSGLLRDQGLGRLDAHLTSCPPCASWVASATRVTRRMRIATAEPAPDLIRPILEAIAAAPSPTSTATTRAYGSRLRQRCFLALRAGLVLVALGQVALAVPALSFGEFAMQSAEHVARETGAWNLALAVGFAGASLRPRLAVGLTTVLGAFVGVLVVITLLDLGAGHVPMDRAASHLVAITGLGLLIGLVYAGWDRGRLARETVRA